ncbi:cold-shock protein [Streptomyces sp. NPDC021224]|uniref:cold-shock protein n=1 Tax=unclassified Streptomyces TaxID=2593676 RepID=UPI003796AD07
MPTGIVENFNPVALTGTIMPTDGTPALQFVAAMIAPATVLHQDARVEYDLVVAAAGPQPHNIRLF